MKGSSEVITQLNEVLEGEVTAVNQYFLHASMCKNWGYLRLYKKIYAESLEEMRHAQRLMDRILFLEGMSVLHQPLSVHVGQDLCRCYLHRGAALEQITPDHTLAQQLLESGVLPAHESATSRLSSVLWNALGGGLEGLRPEVYRARLHVGDTLL